MSIFENIDYSKVNLWVDELTHRIVAKTFVGDDWHEITFAEGTTTLQHVIDSIKEDLREA